MENEFIKTSTDSGIAYGYPECCIREFVAQPPEYLRTHKPTKLDQIRFKASYIKGKYTGFIPCGVHALQIERGDITLESLIDVKKRTVLIPFPNDWSKI